MNIQTDKVIEHSRVDIIILDKNRVENNRRRLLIRHKSEQKWNI